MTNTLEGLRRQIKSAQDLAGVVHTMKVIAAANVAQFERAASASAGYFQTLELGLTACFRSIQGSGADPKSKGATCVIVFGSDQGLVGKFNESLCATLAPWLSSQTGDVKLLGVGRRLESALARIAANPTERYDTANSLGAIPTVIGRILLNVSEARERGEIGSVWLFHNRPLEDGGYAASSQRMLPLNLEWQQSLATRKWPTSNLPEVVDDGATLEALVREYLYVSLFRACAESLASENAGRLAAMQRAESNIQDLLTTETQDFNLLRQQSIDEELFDVVAGFEAQQGR